MIDHCSINAGITLLLKFVLRLPITYMDCNIVPTQVDKNVR